VTSTAPHTYIPIKGEQTKIKQKNLIERIENSVWTALWFTAALVGDVSSDWIDRGPQVCLLLSVTAIVSRTACKQIKFVIGLANSSLRG
jgi:hypothetical protein